jgi:hypothetical protein
MPLSLLSSYYIRKLLHRNAENLKFVVAPNAAIEADALADLNSVLESLYLEDEELAAVINELETLANYHQHYVGQAFLYKAALAKIETRIFWLLGFKTLDNSALA